MATHHYIVGAGMVGCLYDYGPNAHETLESALADAQWHLEGVDGESEDEGALVAAEASEALEALRSEGIHYFSEGMRSTYGAHYIEIQRVPGPCPDADD